MENLERCFFCCKFIPKEKNEDQDNFEIFVGSLKCVATISKSTDYNIIKDHVLRISHYLKVPPSINEEDTADLTSTIKTCSECTPITKNLGELCVQLESIKFKISHYLNLLADQILEIPSEEDEHQENPPPAMSNFQKIVHEKCLFKVQQDNSDPQNDLQKSPVQNFSEDSTTTTTSHSIILEDPDQIKHEIIIEDEPINDVINPELHSCPFCDFVVEGPYDLLHSHITAQHPEHFETEDSPQETSNSIPSSSTKKPDNLTKVKCQQCHRTFSNIWSVRRHMINKHSNYRNFNYSTSSSKPIKTLSNCDACGTVTPTGGLAKHKRLFCTARKKLSSKSLSKAVDEFNCIKCGKSFACRGNLTRHLREIASCAQVKDKNIKKERFECSKCKRQYSRLDYIKKHIETDCKMGLLIDHDTGTRLTLSEVSKKISKCNICGLNVYTKNLSKHVSLKHKEGKDKISGKRKEKVCEYCNRPCGNVGNLRVHMLAAHGVEMRKEEEAKVFNCGECGKSYDIRRSWMRHLQNNEKCRLTAYNLQIGGYGDEQEMEGEGKQEEEEEEVVLSIPEMGTGEYREVLVVEDVNVVGEDPLKI